MVRISFSEIERFHQLAANDTPMRGPTPSPAIREISYHPDSTGLFAALRGGSWPVLLDSGRPLSVQGRYDILTADPIKTLVTRGRCPEIHTADGVRVAPDDPIALLAEALGPIRPACDGLPFSGGAIGYFGYDLARRLLPLPNLAQDAEDLPEMAVGIYDWALVVDHIARRTWLTAPDPSSLNARMDQLAAALDGRPEARGDESFRVLDRVRPNMSREHYLQSVARIKAYLHAGDCYQVNLAQRFAVPVAGDPWPAYRLLRTLNAAPFGAYLETPDWQILCSSPELFLRVHDGAVETRPIKGTCPRSADADEDRRLAQALRCSPKDRAENLMIVDLLRNDLGQVCATGSVRVPRLFAIETFARVHHLVSTVTGRLAAGRTAVDLLRACFPGGFDGAMQTNIAIRTLVQSAGVVRLWAGGGIVADSDPESEYRETCHKAGPLLDLLARHAARSNAPPEPIYE